MKILTAPQIKEADTYTISNEPVQSIELMERASMACVEWITSHFNSKTKFFVFCGSGNNGGDGLAIARLLIERGYAVSICIIESSNSSSDFLENKKRLGEAECLSIRSEKDLPDLKNNNVIIDAIFGTGLNRAADGIYQTVINYLNDYKIISIDMPSGLFADTASAGNPVIHAAYTLTFEVQKLAFMFPENAAFTGEVILLPIGLNKNFIDSTPTNYFLTEENEIHQILKPRNKTSHKGNYGHALLLTGSFGKMGAAVLSAKACLRMGAGLVTVNAPACGYKILQTSVPEAMVECDANEKEITKSIPASIYNVIGMGPGIGTQAKTAAVLKKYLKEYKLPMVLDADALNIISQHKKLMDHIPSNSVLTPHPKEFDRIAGSSNNSFERNEKQIALSIKYNIYIVLKGRYSCISCPDGKCYFNPTGNPGMAKGGCGDILTGMITALLAQGFSSKDAAIAGVYIHGLAADIAVKKYSEYSLLASDIVEYIGEAVLNIQKNYQGNAL